MEERMEPTLPYSQIFNQASNYKKPILRVRTFHRQTHLPVPPLTIATPTFDPYSKFPL
jgi:hypothetical protein